MDNQNYWNGIERRKPNGELEALVAQQAAVIEQMRKAHRQIVTVTNDMTRHGNIVFRDITKIADEALALQPCPEVLNKVRADAVREAADLQWRQAMDTCQKDRVNPSMRNDLFFGISELREYAQRMEQGEA